MATKPTADQAARSGGKAKASGTFRDPFGKWEDGSVRGASKVLKDAKDARSATTAAMNRVQALNSAMGSLSGQEAANAKRLLRVAIKELAEAQKAQARGAKQAQDLVALQRETTGKLAALRTWIMNNELTAGEKKKAAALKKNLEKVIVDLSKSNLATLDFKAVGVTLDQIKTQQASLPQELGDKFQATEDALDKIRSSQDEARAFMEENNKMLREFGKNVLSRLGNLTMRLADKVGIGPFTVGNALRGAGMIGRGLATAGRAVGRAARGETYVQRYMAAKRTLKESGGEGEEGLTGRMIDLMKRFGGSNMWFQRRLLRELEKQGRDKKEGGGAGGLIGKIGAMVTSLMGSVTSFFGAGGILKTLSAISGWLSPLASAGKFLLTRAMPVLGAFLGGWKIGSLIYEKYADEIQGAIDATIGALKNAYDWVGNKLGAVKDWAANMTVDKAKEGIKSAAQSAYSAVSSTMSSVADSVTSTAGKAAAAVSGAASTATTTASSVASTVAASPAGQAIGSAVTGAVDAGKAAGSYISQGVSKLSSLVGSVITKNGNVDLDGLDPRFQGALGNMSQEYFSATGKKLQFNSGYRSNEEQERLYKTKPAGMAAKPGSSLHNYGMAVDVQSNQANELKKLGLLDKYGFTRPISNEPWHVQPTGVSLAAAKAGIYSADSPKNQVASASPAPQSVSPSTMPPSPGGGGGGGGAPGVGGGGDSRRGGNVAGSKPVGVSDIPTHDNSDGLLAALNLGVIG